MKKTTLISLIAFTAFISCKKESTVEPKIQLRFDTIRLKLPSPNLPAVDTMTIPDLPVPPLSDSILALI